MLTDADLAQLHDRGITPDEAADQLRRLRQPPPYIVLSRPCTIGDGIVQLDASEHDRLLSAAREAAALGRVQKFVPASGAATRMFKDLIAALASSERPSTSPAARHFFDRLDDFPFSQELRERTGIRGAPTTAAEERAVLHTLLHEMRYAELPKALIPFHRGPAVRTPFEEHLLEGARYTRAHDGISRTHFTVAPEFSREFESLLTEVTRRVAAASPAPMRVEVTFSVQHPATDTLAVTRDGKPFRTADGKVLLRPAGHGALLRNLQALGGDIVVVKNIDNVLPFERCDEVVRWKELLIGYLVMLHDRADDDRPLRVCGVVRNEGEPGGAPFWVVDEHGGESVQIVEAASVDLANPAQRRIFESSTHFNPVDIACALQAKDGCPFDLRTFVNPSAVFLSEKSHEGRDLIALERPGLWNGGMARWNTVFVEVPASTFAPVKTVFDLLRPEHQSL